MKVSYLLIAGFALAASLAIAQNAPSPPHEGLMPPMLGMLQGPGAPEIDFMHAQIIEMHEQIKGAPYTATAVTESTQVLSDGNRIANKHSGLVARDGEGRIRREESMGHIGPLAVVAGANMIFIHDPVAKAAYVLNPDTKTVRVIRMEGMQDIHNQVFVNGGGGGESGDVVYFKKEFRKESLPAGAHAEMGEVKKESLGTQQVEGVNAEGTRITRTIAAGAIGNERPIDIVSETWTSTDLHVLVLSKRSDPRVGETVYRLTNIKLGEPDAALFQIPSGFTTQQEQPGPMRLRRPGPPPQ
jgi:hypothetical protein